MSQPSEVVVLPPSALGTEVRRRLRFARPEAEAPVGSNLVALWATALGGADRGAVEVVFEEGDGFVRLCAPLAPDLVWPSQAGVLATRAEELRLRALAAEPATLYRFGHERASSAVGAFVFPIGPVRGDVMESAAFSLTGMGDEVLALRVDLGYKFRHVARVAAGRVPDEAVRVVERTTATSTVAHALAFCQAVEASQDAVVPERGALLRSVLAEIERVHSHLLDMASLANATGLPVAQQELLAAREVVLTAAAALTGHRYLRGMVAPGGLTADPGDLAWQRGVAAIGSQYGLIERIVRQLGDTPSFLDRLNAAGIVLVEEAETFAALGPVGRASGSGPDVRLYRPYAGYIDRPPARLPGAHAGDAWARWRVRTAEVRASLNWLAGAVASLPAGAIRVNGPPRPRRGWGLGRAEGPRGEIVYAVTVDPSGTVAQVCARSASLRNWALLPAAAARRNILQDMPIIDASFALSAAGSDM